MCVMSVCLWVRGRMYKCVCIWPLVVCCLFWEENDTLITEKEQTLRSMKRLSEQADSPCSGAVKRVYCPQLDRYGDANGSGTKKKPRDKNKTRTGQKKGPKM